MTGNRLTSLDLARTLALVCMVVFHFTFDLALFGHIDPGTMSQPFWCYFARMIAGSFLFLSGIGLWLAQGRGIRWPAFWKRFAKITAAAALVSIATYFTLPGLTVFYGILHSIAISSLIALAVLRLPAVLTLALAAATFALPLVFRDPAFDGALVWTGLGTVPPVTADFLPLFPWIAPMLAGVAAGRLMSRFALWPRLALVPTRLARALAWPGRHTLAIYLIHQPLMIGAFNLWFWLAA